MDNKPDIYSPSFVKDLFDEMSQTYGFMNYISSFGFAERWRRQCIQQLSLSSGQKVYDLMTGMGECWGLILDKIGQKGHLLAVDLSPSMLQKAQNKLQRWAGFEISIVQKDVLDNDFPDHSADCIISAFGIKTFSESQQDQFAAEIKRLLKPGGEFSLVEISVPPNRLLRIPYLFYINHVIPVVGKAFLGNPDNYRMLGVYTQAFGNCSTMRRKLLATGLDVKEHVYFWGCATGLSGHSPHLF